MDIAADNKRQQKAEATKRRLFVAGMSLMREKGYQAATIRSICSRAGVSVGTFYLYYNTKSDILKEVYMQGDKFMVSANPAEEGKTPLERIRLFIDRYSELTLRTGLDSVKVLYNPDNEWFVQYRAMQHKLDEMIKEGQEIGEIISDTSSEELTDFLFVCMRGVCYHWCTSNGGYDLKERMRRYMWHVLKSLEP